MAYFKVGHEILNKELGKLLTNLNTEVQRLEANVYVRIYAYWVCCMPLHVYYTRGGIPSLYGNTSYSTCALLTLSTQVREGYSTQFVCQSVSYSITQQ